MVVWTKMIVGKYLGIAGSNELVDMYKVDTESEFLKFLVHFAWSR